MNSADFRQSKDFPSDWHGVCSTPSSSFPDSDKRAGLIRSQCLPSTASPRVQRCHPASEKWHPEREGVSTRRKLLHRSCSFRGDGMKVAGANTLRGCSQSLFCSYLPPSSLTWLQKCIHGSLETSFLAGVTRNSALSPSGSSLLRLKATVPSHRQLNLPLCSAPRGPRSPHRDLGRTCPHSLKQSSVLSGSAAGATPGFTTSTRAPNRLL